MERAQALLERGWLDQLSTAAGRADTLCRYTVLFGDPQLAFTAINRILDVTAEEVRAIAAARLRPDNRAVLVYDQVTSEDTAGTAAGEAGQASAARENDKPEGAGR
jgi:predicted Zn-dependent peptidase